MRFTSESGQPPVNDNDEIDPGQRPAEHMHSFDEDGKDDASETDADFDAEETNKKGEDSDGE